MTSGVRIPPQTIKYAPPYIEGEYNLSNGRQVWYDLGKTRMPCKKCLKIHVSNAVYVGDVSDLSITQLSMLARVISKWDVKNNGVGVTENNPLFYRDVRAVLEVHKDHRRGNVTIMNNKVALPEDMWEESWTLIGGRREKIPQEVFDAMREELLEFPAGMPVSVETLTNKILVRFPYITSGKIKHDNAVRMGFFLGATSYPANPWKPG